MTSMEVNGRDRDGTDSVQSAIADEAKLLETGDGQPDTYERPADAVTAFLDAQLIPDRKWAERSFPDGRTVYSSDGVTMKLYPDKRLQFDSTEQTLGLWPDGSKWILDKKSGIVSGYDAETDEDFLHRIDARPEIRIVGSTGEIHAAYKDRINVIGYTGVTERPADPTPRAGFTGNPTDAQT